MQVLLWCSGPLDNARKEGGEEGGVLIYEY